MDLCPPAFADQELYDNTIQLINKFKINKIYETGSYVGKSALILSRIDTNIKVFSYEINPQYYGLAVRTCNGQSNVLIRNISSQIGLKEDIVEADNNTLLFLDAHWEEYWPVLDELEVIINKKLKPCILIHDFFVPDENGKAKFGYDAYKDQPLSFEYIKQKIEQIYQSDYSYFYSQKGGMDVRGVIYIYPTYK